MDVVTITKAQFDKISLEAFDAAARTTVERMVGLAPPEHRHIVAEVGRQCLAELKEA